MARRGRPGLPLEEAERIRAEMRRLLREVYGGNMAELGRALEISGSAVSQNVGGADFGSPTNDPSEETGTKVARLAGLPDRFWKTDAITHEVPQLTGVAIRFQINERCEVVLRTSVAAGEAMRSLPNDILRRAMIASVYAFGVPFELATEAALEAYRAVEAEVRDSQALTPDFWLMRIGQALSGKKKSVSGSYPRLVVAGEVLPEPPSSRDPTLRTAQKR